MDGHARMIAILDSIRQHADPLTHLNVNIRMVELLEQKMKSAPANELMTIKFNYAVELLKCGKNEESILHFKEMIQMNGDKLTEQTKILYEFLALGYMRIGEQVNCINTHTPESCVMPISGEGLYKMTSGPENAIKVYQHILDVFPDDLQTRWLFNLAYMTLGKWPQEVPKSQLLPTSIFKPNGNIRFEDVAIPTGLDARGLSGGVCLEDFDNDGDIDVFVTSSGLSDDARYYRNNGDGTFTERTDEANLRGIVGGLSTNHADYDNDGDRDILILRGAWMNGGNHPNSLLRNNGDGTFLDVTIDAGLLSYHPTQAAAWADYDGDGWLDLFIGNESWDLEKPHPCELYHNNGDGTFTNVAATAQVDYIGLFKAASWGDINNDRLPDLYASNRIGENLLLFNQGGTDPATWRFRDVTTLTGTQLPEKPFPAFFFDYNNDGFEDIFVANYPTSFEDPSVTMTVKEYVSGKLSDEDGIRLYRNNRNGSFTNVAKELGLAATTYAMGNNFGDLDNDGWMDIFLGTGKPDLRALIPNRVFHNLGGKKFEDISMNGFSQIQKGHGVAFADMDNDGDQDVYLVVGGAFEGDVSNNILYENPGNSNNWVTLFVEGTTCNRDAFGARIKVTVLEPNGSLRDIFATVGTGGSFGSSSLRQEIGLADARQIVSVEVLWPKPGVPATVYKNVPMNTAVKLKEGSDKPEPVALKKFSIKKKAS